MVSDAIKPPLVAFYRGYKEIRRRQEDFDRWRAGRPFWGGALLIAGGSIAGYTPFVVLGDWLFRSGSAQIISIMGTFFAVGVILSGVGALVNPEVSNLLGLVGITFTILATLVGNFGGLLVGTFLGIVGGALCVAWRRTDAGPQAPAPTGDLPPEAGQRNAQGAGAGRGAGAPDGPDAAERAAREVQDETSERRDDAR